MNGEKIYEYDLDVTGMTDHGLTLCVGTVNFATGKIHIDAYVP